MSKEHFRRSKTANIAEKMLNKFSAETAKKWRGSVKMATKGENWSISVQLFGRE